MEGLGGGREDGQTDRQTGRERYGVGKRKLHFKRAVGMMKSQEC